MNKNKIESRFNKLASIITEKNNEIVSLIAVFANCESQFKKLLKQNEIGEVIDKELIAIEKKLNTIIRKNITEK